ncbi:peptidylprolyl isomerase [Methanosphaerula palustris]|uniref:peptidylprolyl isomerase n=1 Tax=Methanosphaerula palustris (strain ATCC BAA-1556 / DSM 19958 / E1-9c) TaxID=521011 RepID=B8GKY8_METPE|nr:peptidylprolyl isomerase [Methanosphaerula palustris]ACL17284.1 Peptidylprolyl isomerase [Methanosphaerula palustris E1-9c]
MRRAHILLCVGLILAASLFIAGCTSTPQSQQQTSSVSGQATTTVATAVTTAAAATTSAKNTTNGTSSAANLTGKKAILHTSMGDITIQLYGDMPVTTGNFEKLVQKGFYNNLTFHRVIAGFMIQGGDPKGDGTGGPGYTIPDEFTDHNKNDRGTIAMANAGPNTGGSQFFINLVNNNYLDTKHPAFGTVVSGMDVVDAIAKVKTDTNDRPVQPVTITSAEIV